MIPETFIRELVRVAKSQVGVREQGSNAGRKVREYQATTWLSPASWAWCSAFVCWCVVEAEKKIPLPFPPPNTPRAYELEIWGRKHLHVVRNPQSVITGDIVVYDFSHCGIAVADSVGNTVKVVEGNTNLAGSREGDGVYLRTRRLSSIRSIVAWNRAEIVKR